MGKTKPTGEPALFIRLWRDYLRRRLKLVAFGAAFLVIEGSSLGLLSYLLQPMFDRIFIEGQTEAIWTVGLTIFALFAGRALAGVGHRIIVTRVEQETAAEMMVDLFRHVLKMDGAFFQRIAPGALIERVQGDVAQIQNVWNQLVVGAARDAVSLVSLFVVAMLVDPLWTAVAMVGTPLLILPSLAVQRYVRRKSTQVREIAGRRTTRLDEVFHGVVPVKLNGMERYQESRFAALCRAAARTTIKAAGGSAVAPALIDIAVGIGFVAVLVYGGREIIAGEKTVGQFMSFFTAMALTFQPLRRLGGIAAAWQTMLASLERVYALLDEKPTIADRDGPEARLPESSEIRFEAVEVHYGDQPALNGLSFVARAGQTTAIVGLSGAGKSTVFNALTRLVDPTRGRVTIGGTDIRDLPLHTLRSMFSVVTQDALLFDETVRENILLGREDLGPDQLRAAIEAAHVASFLDRLPGGLDAPVGPRGSMLSGGQRQRVAIARALIRDSRILLLDEATSALDTESEALVQQALQTLSEGRTTLVIAHRLSTIRNADQILVLDQGRLAEQGTHAELMESGGLYRRLHDLQFDGT